MPSNLRHNPDQRLISMANANLTQAARIHTDAGRPEKAARCLQLAKEVAALNQPPAPSPTGLPSRPVPAGAQARPTPAAKPAATPQPAAPHPTPPAAAAPKGRPPPRTPPQPDTQNPLGLTGEQASEQELTA